MMPKMCDAAKERLTNELAELNNKRGNLRVFLEKHRESDELDIRLLRRQAKVMSEYADILETRIKLDDAKKPEVKDI